MRGGLRGAGEHGRQAELLRWAPCPRLSQTHCSPAPGDTSRPQAGPGGGLVHALLPERLEKSPPRGGGRSSETGPHGCSRCSDLGTGVWSLPLGSLGLSILRSYESVTVIAFALKATAGTQIQDRFCQMSLTPEPETVPRMQRSRWPFRKPGHRSAACRNPPRTWILHNCTCTNTVAHLGRRPHEPGRGGRLCPGLQCTASPLASSVSHGTRS